MAKDDWPETMLSDYLLDADELKRPESREGSRVARWLGFAAALLVPALVRAQDAGGAPPTADEAREGPIPPWSEVLDALLNLNIGNIPLWRILAAALLVVAGISLRKVFLERLLGPLRKLLDRTDTTYDDQLLEAVQRPLRWLVNLVAIYFALLVLDLPSELMAVASLILQTVGTVMVAWMVHKLIDVAVAAMADFSQDTRSEIDDYLVPVIGRVLRVALFVLVFMLIVQQWGYDVTSLLAGLGLGGLAFALAARPTLANWFGSIMIFTDRPFVIGDRIDIDAGTGVVEEVGLRSTRIRTREDSLITVPNADIAAKSIENLSARRERRIETTVGLVYGTSVDQVREIVGGIRRLVEEHDELASENAVVRFRDFGDSALEVYVDCYARTTGRGDYFRIREEFLYRISEVVEAAGSSFAFPSRSLYLETPVDVSGGEGNQEE